MATKELDEFEDMDIRVIKAPKILHYKLSRLMGGRQFSSGRRTNKSELVIELLSTHPKIKNL